MKEKMNLRRECHLFVINKCNEHCFHCAYNHLMNITEGNLNFKLLKKINFMKFDQILITGGEPGLLPKHIKLDLINFLRPFNKRIQILTNGTNILDWPDDISKLCHIINFNNIIKAPKTAYSIVLTRRTNLKDLKKCIDTLKEIQKIDGFIHIKNDCINPIPEKKLQSILDYIGTFEFENKDVKKNDNLKVELSTRCHQSITCQDNIIHSRINLNKQCSCTFYNCISK